MKPEEERDLRQLLSLLDRTEQWQLGTADAFDSWRVQPGSALAGDDAKSHPYEVSDAAWHALTVAADHLACLKSSLINKLEKDGFPRSSVRTGSPR